MKFRTIIVGAISVLLSFSAVAQSASISTSSSGYLARGEQMYNIGNYNGAIDQFTHAKGMLIADEEREQADLLIARSYFAKGDTGNALITLNRFLVDYPSSFSVPHVNAAIADLYFYTGRYAGAIGHYEGVNMQALPGSLSEDVKYRLAYSCLRVKAGDSVGGKELSDEDVEGYRQQAKSLFESLSVSPRYRDASMFYQAYMKYEKNDYDYALDDFSAVSKNGELGYIAKYYMCQIHYVKGDFDNVISDGIELLEDGKENSMKSEISRIVGESYYRGDDEENAVKYINQYIETAEAEPMLSAQYILGVLNYRKGEYQAAIKLLSAPSQEENVLGQSAYYYLGQAYRKQGNMPLATMAFEKAAKQSYSKDTQEAAMYNYAVIQNEGGRTPFGKAIEMFESFLKQFPDSRYADEVSEYMVSLYVTGNDYSKALASISRIKSPSDKVLGAKQVVLFNLGVEAISNGKVSKAQDYFTQARALAKYDKELDKHNSLWLGECAYRKGNFEQAAKYQNEFLKAVNFSDSNYALGYYNLGYSRFKQRNYEAARNAFKKAIASGSLSESLKNDANNRIGDTFYYSEDFNTAESYYDKSSGDYSLYQKGIMLGLEKKYKAKVEKMQEVMDKYPSSPLVPMAMLEQADAYVSMNSSKKAIAVYNALIKKYPGNAYARKGMLNKAITERNAKNEASAIEAYKAVISQYPTSEEAVIALEDLKLIYAERGELSKLSDFVASVKNAPKLDVNDMDRLAFEAAEKAYMENNSNIEKMNGYLKSNPDGAYTANAKYYVAKYNFNKDRKTEALELLEELEKTSEDASFMEDALAMKASILSSQNKNKEALATYRKLAEKASSTDNKLTAQLGILRLSEKTGDNAAVIECANELLRLGGLTAEEENEVTFARANASYKEGKTAQAAKDFSLLAQDVRNIYGAKSAYFLAEIQFKNGNLKDAEKTLNGMIDEGTPHEYWLARAFILLADVYHKQGNSFEACEYLESLKNNYPGEEKEIFNMIDERLKDWKKSSKK